MARPDDARPDGTRAPDDDRWIDWTALERRLPLDDLPAFHRALLARLEPGEDWGAAPLRRVQGKVQAALRGLERGGRARRDGERLWVARGALPDGYDALYDELGDG